MVPSDYRLEQVTARLIERLEGMRRTFIGKPERANEAFLRATEEHLDAAIGEMRGLGMTDDPDGQEVFLRREVLETFLPRYHRLATEMTSAERKTFGLPGLYTPLGRIALGVVVVALLFLLPRLRLGYGLLPLIPALLSVPFLPDLAGWLQGRRYRKQLSQVVEDMSLIQSRASDYLPAERLSVADPVSSNARRKTRARTKEGQ